MSYIEKKYKEKILEVFNALTLLDKDILNLFREKSIKNAEKIAKLCALCTRNINSILKKYYPEIKELEDKLYIKSVLKFYFDLIDKLTDFIRNVESFSKFDNRYYDNMIDFISQKEDLINSKYYDISRRELTMFYDKTTRDNLEKILEMKLQNKEREFFTFGALEEEIKKIARINGADRVEFFRYKNVLSDIDLISNPETIINYYLFYTDKKKLEIIGKEIKSYLLSKGYEAIVLIIEFSDLIEEQPILTGSVITNAKLFYDTDSNK